MRNKLTVIRDMLEEQTTRIDLGGEPDVLALKSAWAKLGAVLKHYRNEAIRDD